MPQSNSRRATIGVATLVLASALTLTAAAGGYLADGPDRPHLPDRRQRNLHRNVDTPSRSLRNRGGAIFVDDAEKEVGDSGTNSKDMTHKERVNKYDQDDRVLNGHPWKLSEESKNLLQSKLNQLRDMQPKAEPSSDKPSTAKKHERKKRSSKSSKSEKPKPKVKPEPKVKPKPKVKPDNEKKKKKKKKKKDKGQDEKDLEDEPDSNDRFAVDESGMSESTDEEPEKAPPHPGAGGDKSPNDDTNGRFSTSGSGSSSSNSSSTSSPTSYPSTSSPTFNPSSAPSKNPVLPTDSGDAPANDSGGRFSKSSNSPTDSPTSSPSTSNPTHEPSSSPSKQPSTAPITDLPSKAPTSQPSSPPSGSPSKTPSDAPSTSPSKEPTGKPSSSPATAIPTLSPSGSPSKSPATEPTTESPVTAFPTLSPSLHPTTAFPSSGPSFQPTSSPTLSPSFHPSSSSPTLSPSIGPSTDVPTRNPSFQPTDIPTSNPSGDPTSSPSTSSPSTNPTPLPYCAPPYNITKTDYVAGERVTVQSFIFECSTEAGYEVYCNIYDWDELEDEEVKQNATAKTMWDGAWVPVSECYVTPSPTESPSSGMPTSEPTEMPSGHPTRSPSETPTSHPSLGPSTSTPTWSPSANPTTGSPSDSPTLSPVEDPTKSPSQNPTLQKAPPAPLSSSPTSSPSADFLSSSPTSSPSFDTLSSSESPVSSSSSSGLPVCPDAYDPNEAASYGADTEVEVNNVIYRCNPYPYAFYCTQLDFSPGHEEEEASDGGNELWRAAWQEVDPCSRHDSSGRSSASPTSSPSLNDLSSAPTSQSSMDELSQSPTSQPSIDDLSPSPTAMPVTLYPSRTPTAFPVEDVLTPSPTDMPTEDSLSTSPTNSPVEKSSPTVRTEASAPFGLPINTATNNIPEKRFIQWERLEGADKDIARDSLGYMRSTWNSPGSNSIESWSWGDLYETEVAGAQGLGIISTMWDCHINHYMGYYWNDLVRVDLDLYYVALGWDFNSWENDASEPESNDMYWDELSTVQQFAATQLCYTKELWDEVPLGQWPTMTYAPTSSPSKVETLSPTISSTEEGTSDVLGSTDVPTTDPLSPTLSPVQSEMSPYPTNEVTSDTLSSQSPSVTVQASPPAESKPVNPVASITPEKRYIEWTELTATDKIWARDFLGYSRSTWNNPGSSELEEWGYDDLYDDEKTGAQGLGIANEMWNCHINHYFGFWWGTLEDEGVDQYFSTLGWNKNSWNNDVSTPDTEDMYWDELSPEQQYAAEQVCFTEELWDGVPLADWVAAVITLDPSQSPQQPTSTPSLSPIKRETELPSQQPTASPTSIPTTTPSVSPVSPPPSSSPSQNPITPEPTTAFPSLAPSKSPVTFEPTNKPSTSPVSHPPSQQPFAAPSKSPETPTDSMGLLSPPNSMREPETVLPNLPVNPATSRYPEKRFLEWSSLGDSDMMYATINLGYDEKSWNNPGRASVELWSYHDLYDDEVAGVIGLGMDDEIWDCHVNHYLGYWWEDVEFYELDQYLTILGWDIASWDDQAFIPESEGMYFDELSPEQQAAAVQLCYTKELWDGVAIPDWEN